MFNPTKSFKNKLSSYPREPSLRIGRTVPENAVNLAYYYNPTATDVEKVLTAEAPRNIIDHRVEEGYRYLFDQSIDDDDLFPKYIQYEDEEGYQGRLGRMYVQWYPEAHILQKNVQQTKEIIVVDKSELPKLIEYSDVDGYTGNLFLDTSVFEVTKTKDVITVENLDREVLNHEVSYHIATNDYLFPDILDNWLVDPKSGYSSPWPLSISVTLNGCKANGGNNTKITQYINSTINNYDEAVGELIFTGFEYEQVAGTPPTDGDGPTEINFGSNVFVSSNYKYEGEIVEDENIEDDINALKQYVEQCKNEVSNLFNKSYEATYITSEDTYDYTQIEEFLIMASEFCSNPDAMFISQIKQAIEEKKDIVIYLDRIDMKMNDITNPNSEFYFEAQYLGKVAGRGQDGTYMYNVIAKYAGTLTKTITHIKEVAAEYKATCSYVGIARKVWYDYDGMAYYRGAVTKGNTVGNVNPNDNDEILMFSDENGYLRRPVYITNENGEQELKNFYRIESDYVYLTDVFKDNVACFYKYPLKKSIYDYRGPDDNGFYCGNAVSVYNSNLKDIPSNYKYSIKLKVSEYETIDSVSNDFNIVSKQVPMRYNAELFTSFISSSSDTFKVIYNAFDDNDKDNIALDNGVIEDIYCYPYMICGKDFSLEIVDKEARINKIKLPQPVRIKDTRRYITFTYTITAERKKDNKKITSSPRTVSILNRDYIVPAEYSKFEDRAMIISPESDGIKMSPFDIILYDQAISNQETVITSKDKDFIFTASITKILNDDDIENPIGIGSVNIKCNPDGSGLLTAETTVETGFWDNTIGAYIKKLNIESPYFIENGYIYPGFKVKCVDSKLIKVLSPREDNLLSSWYPRLQFGHYSQILDQYGTHTKVCYTMPEYDEQYFSNIHGKPYVDIFNEKVEIINSHMVKLKCYPIYINENITTVKLYKKINNETFDIKIKNISFSDGVIITKDAISENDNIFADYTYKEESYVYRGYWRNKQDFARIDLNPNMYHTYSDLTYTPSQISPSKNLFNKVIYFFMKPTVIYEVSENNDSLIYDIEDDVELGKVILRNNDTLYHQIDNPQPQDDKDIYIGSVYIRQNTSLHSTILIDARTRGGGILESISDSLRKELEQESDFYLDIGYHDGEPYQENGVIIIRLDKSLLKEFGGRFTYADIEAKVKRWLGLGVYPIIEFVDSYSKKDMPQYNLEVEDSYINVIDVTPEIFLECVYE